MSYTPSGSVDGHTLTIAEMPSHRHVLQRQQWWNNDAVYSNSSGSIFSWKSSTGGTTSASYMNSNGAANDIQYEGGSRSHSHGFTGTAKDINVLQPYLSVFMWKRTA